MKVLRTPEERFANLPDFPFEARYAQVPDGDGGELRVHYLDEGPRHGRIVLLMHGEPSWAFLYRKMIPPLVAAGLRCVVPDLVGFGRSDKPAERADYTYERHVAWMTALLIDQLDLRDATFFGQDWGGLIGLRVVAENADRFSAVVIGNTGLPTGDQRPSDAFLQWQKFSQESPAFPIGTIINNGTGKTLTPAEIAAYDAPFPDDTYKEGARIFPSLVPTSPDDPASEANRRAWAVFEHWEKPFVCAFSDGDPVTAGGERIFLRRVPGTKDQPHATIAGAAHFLQEQGADQLASIIAGVVNGNA